MSWWRSKHAPPKVPTDKVLPVHYFDDTYVFRTFLLYTALVLDDVLDVQTLKTSLERVVQREGWNKLGARLRRHDTGALKYHIPAKFTNDRPAIGFTHLDLSNTALRDHPVGSRIPRPPVNGDRPSIVGRTDDINPLVTGLDMPRNLDDYLYSDRPMLGLRVVSFADATIAILHGSHLVFDAQAKGAVLAAWGLALKGRDDEIPKPQGVEVDPLSELGMHVTVPHKLAERRLAGFEMIKYGLYNLLNLFWWRIEGRAVCVPKAFLDKLREKAMDELAEMAGGDERPFVSEGDVLAAWFARIATCNIPKDSKRTVAILNAFDQRRILEKDLLVPGRPYIGNCMTNLGTLLPASDVRMKPLSYVATAIRQSIVEQGTREQVEAAASFIRADPTNKMLPIYGDAGMQMLFFTNWQKARMFDVDFSAAVVGVSEKEGEKKRKPVTPSCIVITQSPWAFADGFGIPGKDAQGNYWIFGNRVQGLWEMMEKEMAADRDFGKAI